MQLIPAYTNISSIEMVDVKPLAEHYPSAYWNLLIAHMHGNGMADFKDGTIYIPLSAANEFINSEWLNKQADKKESTPMKTYLMRDHVSGHVKIGRSRDIQFREKTLQAQAPMIRLIAWVESDVEAELHKRYSAYRQRGEWFALEPAQVAAIITGFGFSEMPAGDNW